MNTNPADLNPYAAPAAYGAKPKSEDSQAVAIRNAHLSHEASVKSFGLLYFLGAIFVILAGIGMLIGAVTATSGGGARGPGPGFFGVFGVIYLVIGGLQFWVGRGLRQLNQVGRIGGTVFGALGLLGFPLGTLISGYLLYLLWSQKGNMVFSEQYQDVMRATPEIKYKTSIFVWALLAILVLAVVAVVVGLVISGS